MATFHSVTKAINAYHFYYFSMAAEMETSNATGSCRGSADLDVGEMESIHIIVAPCEVPKDVFDEEQTFVKWVAMPKESAAQVSEFVIDQIEQVQPRCISIWAFQNCLTSEAVETTDELKECVDNIVEAWKSNKRHRVVFGTAVFIPNEVEQWAATAEFNAHVMKANAAMKMQPLRLHRAFLVKQTGENILCVDGRKFIEHNAKQGLGSTMTIDALKIVVKWLLLHHKKGMFNKNIPPSNMDNVGMQPTPLGYTLGYYDVPEMTRIMKVRGIFISRRSRSVSRKRLGSGGKPAKRVLSTEQGRTPRKQRIASVEVEEPTQILLRKVSEAYKLNADMYNCDRSAEKEKERAKLDAIFLLFAEKSEKLKKLEKEYNELLKMKTPVSKDVSKQEAEIKRLRDINRDLKADNHWQRAEMNRLRKRLQDSGRDLDDMMRDLKIWKRRAEEKKLHRIEWAPVTKKVNPRRK